MRGIGRRAAASRGMPQRSSRQGGCGLPDAVLRARRRNPLVEAHSRCCGDVLRARHPSSRARAGPTSSSQCVRMENYRSQRLSPTDTQVSTTLTEAVGAYTSGIIDRANAPFAEKVTLHDSAAYLGATLVPGWVSDPQNSATPRETGSSASKNLPVRAGVAPIVFLPLIPGGQGQRDAVAYIGSGGFARVREDSRAIFLVRFGASDPAVHPERIPGVSGLPFSASTFGRIGAANPRVTAPLVGWSDASLSDVVCISRP